MKVRELLGLLSLYLKHTEEDYKAKCLELDVEYIGNHKEKKFGTVIDYICKIHKDKGIQSKDWSHFRTYKKSCPYCSGRNKTTADIIPLIKNKDVLLISDYLGNEKPIQCKCKKCNHEWTTLHRDNLKKSYCEKNGIQLIIIPYWEMNNMKDYIFLYLKERVKQT